MAKQEVGLGSVIIGSLFILILFFTGSIDPIVETVVSTKTMIENTVPVIEDAVVDNKQAWIDAGKVLCDPSGFVLDAIQPYMLLNVNDETRDVLLKIKDGKKITSCEIKILDENLTPIYKSNLNFKSISPKVLGCNLIDCVEKHDLIPTP